MSREDIAKWTTAEVSMWVQDRVRENGNSLPHDLANVLKKAGYDGRKLLALDGAAGNATLQELQVSALGHRLRFLELVRSLRDHEINKLMERDFHAILEEQGSSSPKRNLAVIPDSISAGKPGILAPKQSLRDVEQGMADDSSMILQVAPWRANVYEPEYWTEKGDAWKNEVIGGLEPEFFYGHRGHDRYGNLHYASTGELVFSTSIFVVVFNIETRTQRIFREHTEDVTCIAVGPDGILVASGDSGSQGGIVHVWDSQNLEKRARLDRRRMGRGRPSQGRMGGRDAPGVSHVALHADGERLMCVYEDGEVVLWSWVGGFIMTTTSVAVGSISGLGMNPYHEDELHAVTVGASAVRFWTVKLSQGEELAVTGGKAGIEGSNNGTCVTFLDSVTSVTGMADGSLIVWMGSSATKVIGKAHTGRVSQLCPAGPFLVSGGRDGKVHVWTLSKEGAAAVTGRGQGGYGYGRKGGRRVGGEEIGRTVVALASTIDGDEVCRKIDSMHEATENLPIDQNGKPYSPWDSRSVCVQGATSLWDAEEGGMLSLAFALDTNAVYRVCVSGLGSSTSLGREDTCEVVVQGHSSGGVVSTCGHPSRGLFFSVGDDSTVRCWNTSTRRLQFMHTLAEAGQNGGGIKLLNGTCIDVAEHVCVGMSNGAFRVLSCGSRTGFKLIGTFRPRGKSPVACVRYSPKGESLAVGCTDQTVDMFRRDGEKYEVYRHIQIPLGGYAVSLDWSQDSLVIRSGTSTREVLYWDARSGRHLSRAADQKGVMWHSTSVPMGWEVIGLYAVDSLGYEIVASDRGGDSLLAGGGADGRVKMTRFPSVPDVHCQSILAHPGGVSSLRFAKVTSRDKDLACLITSGAADSTLLQWRVSHGGVKKRRKGNIEDLAEEMRVLVHAMKSPASKKRHVQFESENHWRKAMAAPMKREPEDAIAPKLNKALQQGVLRLEYVHGYRGQDCSGNICPGDDGRFVYPVGVAAVSQVWGGGRNQTIYASHTDQVTCVAVMHVPREELMRLLDRLANPPRFVHDDLVGTLHVAATAQAGNEGRIDVWETGSATHITTLVCKEPIRRVCFPSDYRDLLVTAGGGQGGGDDLIDTFTVWDWVTGTLLKAAKCSTGPMLGLVCNPFLSVGAEPEPSVTWAVACGVEGVAFFRFSAVPGLAGQNDGSSSSPGSELLQVEGVNHHAKGGTEDATAVCGVFIDKSTAATGMGDGDVILWKGLNSVKRIKGVHGSAIMDVAATADYLITGGLDGCVKVWRADTLLARSPALVSQFPNLSRGSASASVRSLSIHRLGTVLAIGLSCNELFTVDLAEHSSAPQMLAKSHALPHSPADDINNNRAGICVSSHPDEPLCLTAGRDGSVRKLDLESMSRKGASARLGCAATATAWSPDGFLVAVGTDVGTVVLLDAQSLQVHWTSEGQEKKMNYVMCLAFSPDGKRLAVVGDRAVEGAEEGTCVALLLPIDDLARPATLLEEIVLEGAVCAMDWSKDGNVIQGGSEMGEIVYWSTQTSQVMSPTSGGWEELCKMQAVGDGCVEDQGWATWRVPAGYCVQGAHDDSAVSIITSVERRGDGTLLAMGDSRGGMTISTYPYAASVPSSNRGSYLLESAQRTSSVASVTFACRKAKKGIQKGLRLVSVGVDDPAVYQWLYKPGSVYTEADERRSAVYIQSLFRGIVGRRLVKVLRMRKVAEEEESQREERERAEKERAAKMKREATQNLYKLIEEHNRALRSMIEGNAPEEREIVDAVMSVAKSQDAALANIKGFLGGAGGRA